MSSPVVAPSQSDQLPPVPAKPAVDPEVQRLQQQLAAQGNTIAQLQQQMRPTLQQQPQPGPVDKKQAEKEFFGDPLNSTANIAHNISEAVVRKAMAEMGPSYETLRETAVALVKAKDPELFTKYEDQIRASVATTPPQFHTNVGTWELAFNKVKGENLRDIISASKPESNRAPAVHISAGGGPAAPSSREPAAPKAGQLSDGEKEVARNLGISDDQYQSGKDHIAGQNERGKSSWDPFITFDSKEKRRQEHASRRAKAKPAAA